MLRQPTVTHAQRAALVRPGAMRDVILRVSLAVIAVVYIVAPTIIQWNSLADERAAVRTEVTSVDPTPMIAPVVDALPPSDMPAVPVPGPVGAVADSRVTGLVGSQVPERFRPYVPAVLDALTASTSGHSLAAKMMGAAIRLAAVAAAIGWSLVVATRIGIPYRPRHAKSGRVSRVFL